MPYRAEENHIVPALDVEFSASKYPVGPFPNKDYTQAMLTGLLASPPTFYEDERLELLQLR